MAVDFGNRLRARAQDLGLSDAEVARRLELSQTRYSNYVNNIREPDYQTLLRICGVLKTSPNILLGYEEYKAPKSKQKQIDKINSAISAMPIEALELVAPAVDAIAKTCKTKASKKSK
ncbi:helix-turn-helix transcriptional regulator [Magnetovibrio sp. PR-2]|uniref:helix-turn-helix domain-containing protein n=1 Tax=Magnetovibrio sp. PR-2 TaxID=3120356 RepID=UPI002FCE499A